MRVPPASVYVPESDRREILARIDEALSTGQLTLGKFGRELEERFTAYSGARYAVAVNSGTSAIEIPLRSLGVEGREVLVPANTFFATAAAVVHAGARVRFLDCDPGTMAVDVEDLKRQIGPETAGVVVVHIGGLVTPDIEEIRRVCDERGVFLFEDAAHAHGSTHGGKGAGTFGIAGSFSFYPTKVMAAGEGGMIITDDERIYQEALIYRDQGKASFTQNAHTLMGSNWRLSELHAAVALSQFARLDEFIQQRAAVARVYDTAFAGGNSGLRPVAVPEGSRMNYYKYAAYLPDGVDRAALKKLLREEYDIGLSGEVYETPLHDQPVFAPYRDRALPGAEQICARQICLPVSAIMSDEQAQYVVDSVKQALERASG
ncbi:MAG: DegT/DnrJ/EryC1/StrS family aminotransferase [Chloroflexi bacterium]|nr:DegT/DnrJ/EryC1/StrS family aminotransferase [Chloroflexota bacterium]